MIVGVFKYILGFLLAIAVLLGSGLTVALYFVNRTAIPPERPKFANDNPKPKPDKPKAIQVKANPKSSPESTPTPTPTPTESPKSLPPGAYQGLVTWPQGLSMREQPTMDAKSVGGVSANQKVIILEESQDKNWQKIRVEGSDQEGWVKAGNTKKVE
ncbi:SH3 domain-containing protein [Anabaena cylindrica FACHB-243]|uniref:SH3 type 3 domain protein n=1 Tax=Anabaena cylindrica (strain ATCC 27899 / PCC 7122) TaxID=272123 RepID=K9ZGC5_ANACC|nr:MULTISPECIES: SH3 domain-containing protein [Anabaena]AFZ58268.1 SH3 type 3 domain protein [Anabaena cylindrica PCC 7122]MBD2419915.1 SH3 domain-containing protein [Anabaena cylindrica FACHB-243]MBY5285124.1 SH3 domain-containing protein [Anabaena sp. CCAP 1446/1C]MBY5307308.1 SH3 domain-containing protein [Anabaena sp. CCAP 1446/1C]MCM2407882.1 SH3 domain-containing protein [Anabaena sp. CCAP 1446/1C]